MGFIMRDVYAMPDPDDDAKFLPIDETPLGPVDSAYAYFDLQHAHNYLVTLKFDDRLLMGRPNRDVLPPNTIHLTPASDDAIEQWAEARVLTVDYMKESPLPASLILETRSRRYEVRRHKGWCKDFKPEIIPFVEPAKGFNPNTHFDAATFKEELDKAFTLSVGCSTHDETAARSHFIGIEYDTHPVLKELRQLRPESCGKKNIMVQFGILKGTLETNRLRRARKSPVPPSRQFSPNERDLALCFMDVFRTHIDKLMTDLRKPLGDALAYTYQQFASGHLRLPMWENRLDAIQPSSGSYFLFGEFALLAAHNAKRKLGADVANDWKQIAEVFVMTQKTFASAYAPKGVEPSKLTPAHYSPCHRIEHQPEAFTLGRSLEEIDDCASKFARDYIPATTR